MRATPVIVLAFALATAQAGGAQSAPTPSAVSDSTTPAATAAPKKKGMFGKIKGLAKNKVVKTVAKAALCTAVPGGQVIAGALDAAETKNVAGAATTAVTGGSSSCMPGMTGNGMAGAAAAAGMGAAAGGGGGVPGMPGGMPGGAMPGTAMSPEQMKQMMEQYSKMGMDPAQIQAMQQMMSAMPGAPTAATAAGAPAAEPASRAHPDTGQGPDGDAPASRDAR
jgi:hypothetical protein